MRGIQIFSRHDPFPVVDGLPDRYHIDAIDRAGWQAQFAAGAFVDDDGVHVFRRTENCVDRAGLDAQGTADTGLLVD